LRRGQADSCLYVPQSWVAASGKNYFGAFSSRAFLAVQRDSAFRPQINRDPPSLLRLLSDVGPRLVDRERATKPFSDVENVCGRLEGVPRKVLEQFDEALLAQRQRVTAIIVRPGPLAVAGQLWLPASARIQRIQ